MEEQTKNSTTKYLANYTPPDFLVDSVALIFELDPKATVVHARLALRRNPACHTATLPPLVLDGQELTLLAIALDGVPLSPKRYRLEESCLVIPEPPEQCILEIKTRIHPATNTSLEGLYASTTPQGPLLSTQCEPEGFRKITYYPDRPDVMSQFTTTLIADRKRFPVLLSNGNRNKNPIQFETATGKHGVTWVDPHRKPAYLFALVAGDLVCQSDTFVTRSGRSVDLEIYTEAENSGLCDHAMAALKKAMAWDEERFGRQYDLDTYMIVAVNAFNMGAMENKGLNIFNAKYVLADQASATDTDFQQIESVIAHEYFHNWTGNRITCRDWFQLSLKEGLTVFRDQLFSADMISPAVQRVQDARLIRTHQFAEDAGPTAHPVQPDSYMEINNFYTLTVYNKGAEVVRMLHTLLGEEGFRRGMDHYFAHHDGHAVTVEAFVQSMEAASGRDLGQFRRWYQQAGTPVVSVTSHHDPATQTLHLQVTQSCPPTPGQPTKQPFHIPLTVGLLEPTGQPLPLRLQGEAADEPAATSRVLELRQTTEQFVFTGIAQPPIASLLRHFSAPVVLHANWSAAELAFLWAHDPDPFNRWSAGQTLATDLLLRLAADLLAGRPLLLEDFFVDSFAQVLQTRDLEPATIAMILTLPAETALLEQMPEADPQALYTARLFVRQTLATRLHEHFFRLYQHNSALDGSAAKLPYHPELAGKRSLKNLCLDYLVCLRWAEFWQLAASQCSKATNMTDRLAALTALLHSGSPEAEPLLSEFARQWQKNSLVMDKWFAIQARIPAETTLRLVRQLQKHRLFSLKNPNRVRALLGAFCHDNPVAFHQPSGKGYQYIAKQVLTLDPINPQVAARLVASLSRWRKLEPVRREKMRLALQQIQQTPNLSKDVFEIVLKSLTH
ncbi:MAG: aminopeptidase N [Magnetococcales bacterium]|nr:aminopeptidase N [Magnetococcales bacterium]